MDWIDALPDLHKALERHREEEIAGLEAHVDLIKRRPEWAYYLELSQDHLLKLFTEVYADVKDEQLEERWSQAVHIHLLNLFRLFGEASLVEK